MHSLHCNHALINLMRPESRVSTVLRETKLMIILRTLFPCSVYSLLNTIHPPNHQSNGLRSAVDPMGYDMLQFPNTPLINICTTCFHASPNRRDFLVAPLIVEPTASLFGNKEKRQIRTRAQRPLDQTPAMLLSVMCMKRQGEGTSDISLPILQSHGK